MERTYGNKYDTKLSTTEIAVKVRADIKTAIKEGKLPKAKYSVRSEYFAGGSAIRVKIGRLPFLTLNRERVRFEVKKPHSSHNLPIYTPEAWKVRETLEKMLAAYNHDGSDLMTDYFDVRFYGSVDFDWEATKEEREEIEVMLKTPDSGDTDWT